MDYGENCIREQSTAAIVVQFLAIFLPLYKNSKFSHKVWYSISNQERVMAKKLSTDKINKLTVGPACPNCTKLPKSM